MNNHPDVATLYKTVIEDVIVKVRGDFLNMGLDEQVLFELQELWETKLIEAKVLLNLDTSLHQGDILPPIYPGLMPTTAGMPTGPSSAGSLPSLYQGYYTPFIQHPPSLQMGAAANLANLANRHYSENGNVSTSSISSTSSYQQGRSSSSSLISVKPSSLGNRQKDVSRSDPLSTLPVSSKGDSDNSHHQISKSPTKSFKIQKLVDHKDSSEIQNPNSPQRGEDSLGSDLDDSDEDLEQDIDNVILCQYEKAARTKTKWRCTFKDGIVHVNGVDYAFHKASGEFEWI